MTPALLMKNGASVHSGSGGPIRDQCRSYRPIRDQHWHHRNIRDSAHVPGVQPGVVKGAPRICQGCTQNLSGVHAGCRECNQCTQDLSGVHPGSARGAPWLHNWNECTQDQGLQRVHPENFWNHKNNLPELGSGSGGTFRESRTSRISICRAVSRGQFHGLGSVCGKSH